MGAWASLPEAGYVAYLVLGAQQHDALGTFLATLKRAGLHAYARYVVGIPGAELGKLDLLALGSHGYGALESSVLGSVATRVAAQCQVALLLIREK
ncbi:MAG: universal stress protein [Rhodoferax sp.]